MLKFGPFSGHFDHLARIRVLARNFGSTGSSVYVENSQVSIGEHQSIRLSIEGNENRMCMKIMDDLLENATARKWSCNKGTKRYDFSLAPRPFSHGLVLTSPSMMMIRRRTRIKKNRKRRRKKRRKIEHLCRDSHP